MKGGIPKSGAGVGEPKQLPPLHVTDGTEAEIVTGWLNVPTGLTERDMLAVPPCEAVRVDGVGVIVNAAACTTTVAEPPATSPTSPLGQLEPLGLFAIVATTPSPYVPGEVV